VNFAHQACRIISGRNSDHWHSIGRNLNDNTERIKASSSSNTTDTYIPGKQGYTRDSTEEKTATD
jgi:hypothetical protein